jgi:hypothetical protein
MERCLRLESIVVNETAACAKFLACKLATYGHAFYFPRNNSGSFTTFAGIVPRRALASEPLLVALAPSQNIHTRAIARRGPSQ